MQYRGQYIRVCNDNQMQEMNKFQPHIIPIYPPHNELIFEEWFALNYNGCNTDRVLLPFFPTSYWVNNNYAQDLIAKKETQDYIDSLPNDIKYFVICQYDDGCLIDWKDKDVLEFNMSKKIGVELPLLCMPHPYKFSGEKKYFASFVGGRTHPLRNELEQFKNKEGWYISYDLHPIERYCEIISQSAFTICPRGYGINSFRIAEALQYGSIPVYISDYFIEPFDHSFDEIGMTLHSNNIHLLPEKIRSKSSYAEIMAYQELGKIAYEKYYTYEGCFNQIIKSIEAEYNSRKEETEITKTT